MYRKSGARLVAVCPQLSEHSRATIEEQRLNFEILFDKDNGFAKQLDLVHGFPDELKSIYQDIFGIDVGAANDNPVWELPVPARIVTNSKHSIKAIEVNASYTERPEPEETLNVVMN